MKTFFDLDYVTIPHSNTVIIDTLQYNSQICSFTMTNKILQMYILGEDDMTLNIIDFVSLKKCPKSIKFYSDRVIRCYMISVGYD